MSRWKARAALARFIRARYIRLGLSVKMALMVIASTVVLVVVLGYLGTTALEQSVHRTLQERVVLAQTTARHLDSLLALIDQVLTESAQHETWQDPASRERAVEHTYRRLGSFATRVFLVDSNAAVIAAYPPLPAPFTFDQFAAVAAVLRGQSFAVSRYARVLSPGDSSTIAVVPVRDAEQRIVYALLVALDLASPDVRVFTHPIGLGSTGYMDLIDASGTVLASTRAARLGEHSDHADYLTRAISARQPTTLMCHTCHSTDASPMPQTEMLAFAPLERAQWGVTVRQREAEVFEATRALQARVVLVGVFTLALGILLAFALQRAVIAPTQALTIATRRIAAGDWTTPVPTRGRDEIGDLARAFEAMRVRLYAAMEEIRAWNRELDARVKARTAECEATRAEIESLYLELQRKEHIRRELLHRVISAQEEERKRIARELHDTTSQTLIGMVYRLERANEMLARGKLRPAEVRAVLEKLLQAVQSARAEVNRVIWDLRPLLLDQLGLVPAIRNYAETRLDEDELEWSVHIKGEPRRLAPLVEGTLYRVAQEALNNIARHARARHVELTFEYSARCLYVRICDDGVGFDLAALHFSRDGARGLGLLSMEERMKVIGGEVQVQSAPGAGTTVVLTVPLEE